MLTSMHDLWIPAFMFFGVFALVIRKGRASGGSRHAGQGRGSGVFLRPCRQPGCGHWNRSAARYCAQCGHRLDDEADLDRDG